MKLNPFEQHYSRDELAGFQLPLGIFMLVDKARELGILTITSTASFRRISILRCRKTAWLSRQLLSYGFKLSFNKRWYDWTQM